MLGLRRTAASVALLASAVIVVGSLGPWVDFSAAILGTVSINGLDEAGATTLGIGLVGLILALVLAAEPFRFRWLALLLVAAFVLSGGIGIYHWRRAGDRLGEVESISGGLARASAGWGLEAITFASLAGLVVALYLATPARAGVEMRTIRPEERLPGAGA